MQLWVSSSDSWILLMLLLVPCRSTMSYTRVRKEDRVCDSHGFSLVEAKFRDGTHRLCLKLQEIGLSALTTSSTTLLVNPDIDETGENVTSSVPLSHITMAAGFPVEDPGGGTAEGYIGDDGHFYGVLHWRNRTLHADPRGADDPERRFGSFENDNLMAPGARPARNPAQADQNAQGDRNLTKRSQFVVPFGPVGPVPFLPFHLIHKKRPRGVASARVCELLLLADKMFYEKDANSSLNQVVRRMMHAIAQADIIFRNADFNEDGVPDNVGFSVKYILVLTSNDTNSRVFGDLTTQNAVDGRQYLMKFARIRRLSEVCLGVAFSGHAFFNRTLGLSFTSLGGGMGNAAGGLCDRRSFGHSFNTLTVAHATTDDSRRVPERVASLTLAHEMGHSFGAHHDDNFPNPECQGFLMGSQSSTANDPMHFEFSMCSKRLIAHTLSSMSYCLSEEDRPYCGNGIVEEGEACDCGLPSRCSMRDPCCTPRAGGVLVLEEGTLHKEGCSVAPSAACHPSQGLCCTPGCQFMNLTAYGIDCQVQDQECACPTMNSTCRCGLGGRCLPDGSCHAAECALLGLTECQCTHKATDGAVGMANLCGICCLLPASGKTGGRCVAAEVAASTYPNLTCRQPWPDEDYSGPNVSVKLCEGHSASVVRAWEAGSPCVTLNIVGICSRGVCKPGFRIPRSNVYPEAMAVKLTNRKLRKSSANRIFKLSLTLLITITVLQFKIKHYYFSLAFY